MGFLNYFHGHVFLLVLLLGGGLTALIGCMASTVMHFREEGYYIGISLTNSVGIIGSLFGFGFFACLSGGLFSDTSEMFLFYFVVMCILLFVSYGMLYLSLYLSHRRVREFVIYGLSHVLVVFLATFILGYLNVDMIWPA